MEANMLGCRWRTVLKFSTMNSCLVFVLIFNAVVQATEVLRPRGVPLHNKIFYDPSRDFSCLDGSAIVPFNFVNDDYCDCGDGSDEPGTAACTNGVFHCTNAGHIPQNIPSSRVNDGICDCCDASDEYNSTAECISNCRELGQRAREETQRKIQLHKQGYELRQELVKKGKLKKEDFKVKLEELRKQEIESSVLKDEKDVLKREAEDKEKVVKDQYKSLEDEKRNLREAQEMELHQEEEKKNAEDAFVELDKNQDGLISYKELQDFPIFDSNRDGTVSEDEAKFFLHMKDEMELEEFITTGWMIMKPIYMMDKITRAPPTHTTSSPDDDLEGIDDLQEDDVEEPAENEQEDEQEDEEIEDVPKFPPNTNNDTTDKKDEIIYDEESQKIIDAAKDAREAFLEAERNLRKIQDEIKDLQLSVETDFGPEEEYATLKDQCFEYEEREYTYKLCPFERAAQIPKNGGSEVSLGRGGTWVGPEDNKYSKLKLDGGMVCWNGPARSVVVSFHCGLENKIFSTSEPNRCEYHFDFQTPTACSTPPSELHGMDQHDHDEL